MVFRIKRTSSPSLEQEGHEEFPCEEAYLASQVLVEKIAYGPAFYRNTYVVKIASLSDLVEFSRKYGEIIIDGETLEIYDDYRE